MVQMSLFAGRDRDADIENGHMDIVGGGGETNWESKIDIGALARVKQLVGTCCVAQGAQLSTPR